MVVFILHNSAQRKRYYAWEGHLVYSICLQIDLKNLRVETISALDFSPQSEQ
jgi:hypothetical protein